MYEERGGWGVLCVCRKCVSLSECMYLLLPHYLYLRLHLRLRLPPLHWLCSIAVAGDCPRLPLVPRGCLPSAAVSVAAAAGAVVVVVAVCVEATW